MARPLRIEQAGSYYHIVARGTERREIFPDDTCRDNFCRRLAELPVRFSVEVHAFVLMDNHYHLLLLPRGLNLSQAVQWINVGYSVWFNRKKRRVGPLFQGRFKSVLVGDAGRLIEISRYIHLNPVRIRKFGLDTRSRKNKEKGVGPPPDARTVQEGLQHLAAYSWSSYPFYVGLREKPVWLETDLIMGMGKTRYRHYVEEGIRLGMPESPWENSVHEGFLGSKEQLSKLKSQISGNRQEQKGMRQLEGLLDWEKIVKAMERTEGKAWAVLCGEHGNPARDLALLLGRRYAGMSLRELGEKSNGITYSAVSEAVRRIQKLVGQKPVKDKWNKLTHLLNI